MKAQNIQQTVKGKYICLIIYDLTIFSTCSFCGKIFLIVLSSIINSVLNLRVLHVPKHGIQFIYFYEHRILLTHNHEV